MKNKIYYLGWIGCLLAITGGLFKIMHWPLAGIFLTLGLSFLALIFFPIALLSNYNGLGKKKPLLYFALNLTIFLNIAGALFKIQHWPGAGYLMIAGILSPLVLFLPVYLYYHIKSEEQSLNNFFSILFLLVFLSVMDALLTVRLGKEAIEAPIIAMNTGNLNEYITIKKEVCYRQLNDSILQSKLAEANSIKSKSELLNTLITDIKKEIIFIANGSSLDNYTEDMMALRAKDNSNIPAFVLFNDNSKGAKLREGIEDFRNLLLLTVDGHNEEIQYILQLLQIDKPYKGRNWEENEFINSPVVYALYQLNTIQNNIAFAEIATLDILCKGKMK